MLQSSRLARVQRTDLGLPELLGFALIVVGIIQLVERSWALVLLQAGDGITGYTRWVTAIYVLVALLVLATGLVLVAGWRNSPRWLYLAVLALALAVVAHVLTTALLSDADLSRFSIHTLMVPAAFVIIAGLMSMVVYPLSDRAQRRRDEEPMELPRPRYRRIR